MLNALWNTRQNFGKTKLHYSSITWNPSKESERKLNATKRIKDGIAELGSREADGVAIRMTVSKSLLKFILDAPESD